MRLALVATLIIIFSFSGVAQNLPGYSSYQAVARDGDGEVLINANLDVRIAVLIGSFDGDIVWEEEHNVQTDAFGLFSLEIGNGTSTGTGTAISYSNVNWGSDSHFLQVEIDPGDGIYELIGVSQFLAVPYAYHAGTVENDEVNDADADPENESIDSFNLSDQTLTIIENGDSFEVDLSSLEDDGDWVVEGDVIYNDQQDVGINTDSPNSTIEINGSFARNVNYISISDDLTITLSETDHTIIAELNSANMTINLPAAETCPGREYIVKAISDSAVNNITITTDSGDIDGESEITINGALKESAHLISSGEHGWFLIN